MPEQEACKPWLAVYRWQLSLTDPYLTKPLSRSGNLAGSEAGDPCLPRRRAPGRTQWHPQLAQFEAEDPVSHTVGHPSPVPASGSDRSLVDRRAARPGSVNWRSVRNAPGAWTAPTGYVPTDGRTYPVPPVVYPTSATYPALIRCHPQPKLTPTRELTYTTLSPSARRHNNYSASCFDSSSATTNRTAACSLPTWRVRW